MRLSDVDGDKAADDIQQPPPSLETDEAAISESIILDRLIDALRDENDFAKSINDRIREELPACN